MSKEKKETKKTVELNDEELEQVGGGTPTRAFPCGSDCQGLRMAGCPYTGATNSDSCGYVVSADRCTSDK